MSNQNNTTERKFQALEHAYNLSEREAIRAESRIAESDREQYLDGIWRYFKPHPHGLTYKYSPQYSPLRKHNSATLVATFQGKYVHVQTKYYHDQPQSSKRKRGIITDFSSGSRRRMFDLFKKLEIKKRAVFLTLTYGEDYPDAETAKNHLRALFERIRRKFPREGVSAIWRMEFQERGAPHFHIIFFNLPFWDKVKIQHAWGAITETDKPFTRIEMIRSHRSLMGYVSKYIAKVDDGCEGTELGGFNDATYLHAYRIKYGDEIGRLWGYFNKSLIPFAPCHTYEIPLNYAKFFKFRDLAIKKYPKIAEYRAFSFRLYVHSARDWGRYFDRLFTEEIVQSGLKRVHWDECIDFMHT